MAGMSPKPAFDPITAMLAAYDTNQQMNELMLESVAPEAWRAAPPQPVGATKAQGRTIAAVAAHMHNVRLMWLKAVKAAKLPEKLEPDKVTQAQAIKSHRESHAALRTVLEDAMRSDGRIPHFPPDAARFHAYLVAHDAHHRGQISMLARLVGYPISKQAMFGLWEWNRKK